MYVLMMESEWGWGLREGLNFQLVRRSQGHFQAKGAVGPKLLLKVVLTLKFPIYQYSRFGDGCTNAAWDSYLNAKKHRNEQHSANWGLSTCSQHGNAVFTVWWIHLPPAAPSSSAILYFIMNWFSPIHSCLSLTECCNESVKFHLGCSQLESYTLKMTMYTHRCKLP